MEYPVTKEVLSPLNHVQYRGHTVKIKELHEYELIIQYSDATLLPVLYDNIQPIRTVSNVLISAGLTLQSSSKILNHTKEIYELNVLGKRYLITGMIFEDHNIWRFDMFLSFHYFHQLQNICRLVNPTFDLKLF